ncbi:glycosyltransferase family 61 protein [archaeon]|nr:MAG: glycosyltransferase family 61 protein [archaeon]
MIIMIGLIALLLCVPLLYSKKIDYTALMDRWRQEITSSLQRSIVNCPYNVIDQTKQKGKKRHQVNSNASFSVYPLYPSKAMVDYFNKLKPQLTKSNPQMIDIATSLDDINSKTYKTHDAKLWVVPPDSPGQNKSNCFRLLQEVAHDSPVSIYHSYYPIQRAFYLLRIENGVVYHDGTVAASCGRYVPRDGCEVSARNDNNAFCYLQCLTYLYEHQLEWYDLFEPAKHSTETYQHVLGNCSCLPKRDAPAIFPLNVTVVDEVFVASAVFDFNYYHLTIDSLARLSHHLPFLRQHPEIKIQFFRHENLDPAMMNNPDRIEHSFNMLKRMLELLDINPNRVVTSAVFARVVYIPRNTFCQHAAYNSVEMLALAKELLKGAHQYLSQHSAHLPELVRLHLTDIHARGQFHVDQHFLSKQRFVANGTKILLMIQKEDSKKLVSSSSSEYSSEMRSTLERHFPDHKVLTLVVKHHKHNYCTACEIFLFSIADIVVGEYGAGLTNIIFMRPGSLLVETVNEIDDRHFPYCGYYNSLSGGLGVHHYIHAYRQQSYIPHFHMNVTSFASSIVEFYRNLTMYEVGQWRGYHNV